MIYGTTNITEITATHISHFIKSLLPLLPFFQILCSNDIYKWNTNRIFTMASAYQSMADTGVLSPYYRIL
jgi:hypothetical protein